MVAPIFRPARVPSPLVAERAALSRREALHDAGLVRRFNAGDETAFVEIVSRYRAKMLVVALGLLRNRADAEEIAQDTFIRAHRGLARFRGDASLAAWLYRITLNLSRNRYWYFFRRRRHASLPLDASVGEGNSATFAELVACDAPGPVQEATTGEFSAIVTECMSRLPAGQRDILTLRNVQQHSYSHISLTMGIRVGTAKSRIARARTNLRVLLGKAYPEFDDASPFTCFEPRRRPPAGLLRLSAAVSPGKIPHPPRR
ncbi:RNA polymerase sigma factor [Ancylobacter sp.]|uniref:RNA polymerase sigma factor n=1 Tax=Ancylobacter sp. TaxID=1872567 RepID=UPI003C7D8B81